MSTTNELRKQLADAEQAKKAAALARRVDFAKSRVGRAYYTQHKDSVRGALIAFDLIVNVVYDSFNGGEPELHVRRVYTLGSGTAARPCLV